jgi:propionyl-CoA carboxylase alpha chain
VFEHEAFRSGILTPICKKSIIMRGLKINEAKIAGLALKQYFEDQKIVRLPNQ